MDEEVRQVTKVDIDAYGDFDSILVADQTDIGCPGIAGNDSGDKYEAFIISSIRCGNVSAIGGPAGRRIFVEMN